MSIEPSSFLSRLMIPSGTGRSPLSQRATDRADTFSSRASAFTENLNVSRTALNSAALNFIVPHLPDPVSSGLAGRSHTAPSRGCHAAAGQRVPRHLSTCLPCRFDPDRNSSDRVITALPVQTSSYPTTPSLTLPATSDLYPSRLTSANPISPSQSAPAAPLPTP